MALHWPVPRYARRVGRSRWLTKRALIAHVVIIIWFPGCFVAAWWQVTVALAGDSLGYLYSVEWPVFAIFGAIAWWNVIHDDPEAVGQRGLRFARLKAQRQLASLGQPGFGHADTKEAMVDSDLGAMSMEDDIATQAVILGEALRRPEEEDEQLAAYNNYLAQLHETRVSKSWRRS